MDSRELTTRVWSSLSSGLLGSAPLFVLLGLGFFGPLALVILYSVQPRGSFSPFGTPTLENYRDIIEQAFYLSCGWSLLLAIISTALLLIICYPLALALKRYSGAMADTLTLLAVAPLFVAENIRLTGWVLFFDKAEVHGGSSNDLFGLGPGT